MDGGVSWAKRFTISAPPGRPGALGCPCDQTFDYGRGGQAVGTFLAGEIVTGTTTNPDSEASWVWRAPGGVTQTTNLNSSLDQADQPWLLVNRDPTNASQDNAYVAYDDFSTFPIPMRISASYGASPPNFTSDNVSGFSTGGGVNPGHRLAVDPRNGFVYSLFQQCVSGCAVDAGTKTINYVLNRSTDGGATWGLNGSANGIVVATANSSQPRPKFGTVNALLGGALHAAVDANTGDVYYVYGNRDAVTGNNRLAIRRIQGNGAGGVTVGPESFVTSPRPLCRVGMRAVPSSALAPPGPRQRAGSGIVPCWLLATTRIAGRIFRISRAQRDRIVVCDFVQNPGASTASPS